MKARKKIQNAGFRTERLLLWQKVYVRPDSNSVKKKWIWLSYDIRHVEAWEMWDMDEYILS